MNPNEDFIYNWSNSLRKTEDGAVHVATAKAEQLRTAGYSARDTSDILVADDFDIKVVDGVINSVYASKEEEVVVAEVKSPTYVVPTSYEDIRPFVEETLRMCSGREFMSRLAHTEHPIIKSLSMSGFESLVRLAEQAKNDEYALNIFHKDLVPFLETAMYENVALSEANKPKTVVASINDDDYNVSYSTKDVNQVSVKLATCTCDKYTKGNYADFGLACEHIVSAADVVSPNHKLPRNFVG